MSLQNNFFLVLNLDQNKILKITGSVAAAYLSILYLITWCFIEWPLCTILNFNLFCSVNVSKYELLSKLFPDSTVQVKLNTLKGLKI